MYIFVTFIFLTSGFHDWMGIWTQISWVLPQYTNDYIILHLILVHNIVNNTWNQVEHTTQVHFYIQFHLLLLRIPLSWERKSLRAALLWLILLGWGTWVSCNVYLLKKSIQQELGFQNMEHSHRTLYTGSNVQSDSHLNQLHPRAPSSASLNSKLLKLLLAVVLFQSPALQGVTFPSLKSLWNIQPFV